MGVEEKKTCGVGGLWQASVLSTEVLCTCPPSFTGDEWFSHWTVTGTDQVTFTFCTFMTNAHSWTQRWALFLDVPEGGQRFQKCSEHFGGGHFSCWPQLFYLTCKTWCSCDNLPLQYNKLDFYCLAIAEYRCLGSFHFIHFKRDFSTLPCCRAFGKYTSLYRRFIYLFTIFYLTR